MSYIKTFLLTILFAGIIPISAGQEYHSKYSGELTNVVARIKSANDASKNNVFDVNNNMVGKSFTQWLSDYKKTCVADLSEAIGRQNHRIIKSSCKDEKAINALKDDISENAHLCVALKDKKTAKAYSQAYKSHLRTDIKMLRYLSSDANIYQDIAPKLMSKYASSKDLSIVDTKQNKTIIINTSSGETIGEIDESQRIVYIPDSNNEMLNMGLMRDITYQNIATNTIYKTDEYGRCVLIEKKYLPNRHEVSPLKKTKLGRHYSIVKKELSNCESDDTWIYVVSLDLGGSVNGANVDLLNSDLSNDLEKFEEEFEKLLQDTQYAKKQITYTVKREYEKPIKGVLSYRPKAYKYSVSIDGKVVKEKQFINVVN